MTQHEDSCIAPFQQLMNNERVCSTLTSSLASTWKEITPALLKASYWPKQHSSNNNFTNWIDDLFLNFYGYHQLRASTLYPADPATTKELLKIVSNRLKHLTNETSSYQPPLHILVCRGSVTWGMGCGANPVGIPGPGKYKGYTDCAWPAQLENLFNEGLFGNNSVVKVSNIASGGASSEVGKVVLEYKLFPAQVKKDPVHVVIWAHAPNDAHESDKDRVFYEYLPGFVNAARSLDKCNKNFPMVVILEDFYGFQSYGPVNEISGYLSELSLWYRLISVNHANVIKHALWANFDSPQVISHILGGNYNLHSGMGHHAGVASTMLYNFLSAFIDLCASEMVGVEIPPSLIPMKFLGAYDTSGKYDRIQPTWRQNKEDAREYCSKQMLSKEGHEPCTYAFMANTMAGMWNPRALRIKMQGVLKASDSWEASGDPSECFIAMA